MEKLIKKRKKVAKNNSPDGNRTWEVAKKPFIDLLNKSYFTMDGHSAPLSTNFL
jgi:hypothetical protein